MQACEWSGLGSAWRLSDALAGLLAGQLVRRHEIQAARHQVWDQYALGLADWAESTRTRLPTLRDRVTHPAHLFWLLLPDRVERRDFVAHCAAQGIEVARHFGSLPRSAFGATVADPADGCPTASRFGEQLVRLPLHTELAEHHVQRVLDAVLDLPMYREH